MYLVRGEEGQPVAGQILEFKDSGGLGLEALSARCPPVRLSLVKASYVIRQVSIAL